MDYFGKFIRQCVFMVLEEHGRGVRTTKKVGSGFVSLDRMVVAGRCHVNRMVQAIESKVYTGEEFERPN